MAPPAAELPAAAPTPEGPVPVVSGTAPRSQAAMAKALRDAERQLLISGFKRAVLALECAASSGEGDSGDESEEGEEEGEEEEDEEEEQQQQGEGEEEDEEEEEEEEEEEPDEPPARGGRPSAQGDRPAKRTRTSR